MRKIVVHVQMTLDGRISNAAGLFWEPFRSATRRCRSSTTCSVAPTPGPRAVIARYRIEQTQ